MHHHYQPPHLIEKDFGLSKDGKSTWSLRRRGRNAKTAQSSVGVGGTPTQPNFESRVRRSKFSQFARDGMLVMACIMQMFYPMNSMACIMWMLYPMTNFWHLRTHGARDAARCFFAWKFGSSQVNHGTTRAKMSLFAAHSWPYGRKEADVGTWWDLTIQFGQGKMKSKYCALCELWLNGRLQFLRHLKGYKHHKNKQKRTLLERLRIKQKLLHQGNQQQTLRERLHIKQKLFQIVRCRWKLTVDLESIHRQHGVPLGVMLCTH